jgi:hypothetical protein
MTEVTDMAEYIKKEDVYRTLSDYYHHSTDNQHMALREALDRVPAADVVERKVGRWISYIEDGYLECPFCGAATNCDGDESELHFCFSCGAKMEGVRNDV